MRLLLFAFLLVPAAVAAQDRAWEIEGYGGALVAQPASAGTTAVPPAGPPIATSTPTFPSRAASSWFFGDGASLLNGALQDFGLTARIAPLDTAFARLDASRVAAFGVRVRRRFGPRTSFEVGVETLGGSPVDVSAVAAAVDTARASFTPAFTDLFASGPFAQTGITVAGETVRGSYRERTVSAAFNRDVGRPAAFQPYVTAGAALVAPRGTLLSATLTGRYTTAILGEVPIDETDAVSVRVTRSPALAIVAGGGVRRDLGTRWRLRLDARLLTGPDGTRIRVDAAPASVHATPAGFIESFTNPAIQFSNDPASGRVSSLSGNALHDVDVFKGGWIARTIVTVAIARRF